MECEDKIFTTYRTAGADGVKDRVKNKTKQAWIDIKHILLVGKADGEAGRELIEKEGVFGELLEFLRLGHDGCILCKRRAERLIADNPTEACRE